jgi:hypothetical protein
MMKPLSIEMPPGPQPAVVKSQDGQDSVALLNDALKRIADLEALVRSPNSPSALRGKPGRKATTADIAAFANERRLTMSWKGIYYAWKRAHPKDRRNNTLNRPARRSSNWRRKLPQSSPTAIPIVDDYELTITDSESIREIKAFLRTAVEKGPNGLAINPPFDDTSTLGRKACSKRSQHKEDHHDS